MLAIAFSEWTRSKFACLISGDYIYTVTGNEISPECRYSTWVHEYMSETSNRADWFPVDKFAI